MRYGVEATAYLVNESRARRPDLAADPLAREWIPGTERAAVRDLWDEFASIVYPDDDLVVSLRGRCVLDALAQTLSERPDTMLMVCGAGFSSYPWLLPFPAAIEVDLPDIITAKRRRVGELTAAGIIDKRHVEHLAADLNSATARRQVVDRAREVANGRPVAYVAEGLVFYLPADAARAVVGLGTAVAPGTRTVVSYWPAAAADSPVLAAQRRWFRRRSVPEDATYLTVDDLATIVGGPIEEHSPEDLQHRYLGDVVVPGSKLIPEYVAVARP